MTELAVIEGEIVDVPNALAPATLFRTEDPREVVARATDMATVLADVIAQRKLFKKIGDKNHVYVEAWTMLGSMLGVFPVLEWSRPVDGGWEARVVAQTRDGAIVGAAEAQCTRAESLWRNRDEYAIRSMAQTRATSKALRQPLGFVITLAGYSATPAEEMDFQDRGREPTDTMTGRENPDRSAKPTAEAQAGSTPAPEALPESRPETLPATKAQIGSLVKQAAELRKTTQKAVKEALANDGYNLDFLSPQDAEQVVGKLERWVAALTAQVKS